MKSGLQQCHVEHFNTVQHVNAVQKDIVGIAAGRAMRHKGK